MGETSVTIANLSSLIEGIQAALAFIWSIFETLVNTIASNPLLLWSTGLAIVCGTVLIGIGVVKKFGLKGRRR